MSSEVAQENNSPIDDIDEAVDNIDTGEEVEEPVNETEARLASQVEADFSMSRKSSALRAVITALRAIGDEIRLSITKEGVKVNQMDASHVCMVTGTLPAKAFSLYNVATEGAITIDIARLLKILKRIEADEYVSLSIENATLKVSNGEKSFNLVIYEDSDEKTFEPNLKLGTKVVVSVDAFLEALSDIALAESDHLQLVAENGSMRFASKGDIVNANVGINAKKSILDYVASAPQVSSCYGMGLLSNIVKSAKDINGKMTVEYDKDMPIRLTFGDLVFYLAPRIESE